MSDQRFVHRDREVVFEVTRQGATIELRSSPDAAPRRFVAHRVGNAEYVLTDAGDVTRKHTVFAVRDGDAFWLHVDGRTWLLQRTRRRAEAAAAGDLTAPIPATVQEILVRDGEGVQASQVLMVLTAMKMQLEIKAPYAGTVQGLRLSVGDQVDAGIVLLHVEPD